MLAPVALIQLGQLRRRFGHDLPAKGSATGMTVVEANEHLARPAPLWVTAPARDLSVRQMERAHPAIRRLPALQTIAGRVHAVRSARPLVGGAGTVAAEHFAAAPAGDAH